MRDAPQRSIDSIRKDRTNCKSNFVHSFWHLSVPFVMHISPSQFDLHCVCEWICINVCKHARLYVCVCVCESEGETESLKMPCSLNLSISFTLSHSSSPCIMLSRPLIRLVSYALCRSFSCRWKCTFTNGWMQRRKTFVLFPSRCLVPDEKL